MPDLLSGRFESTVYVERAEGAWLHTDQGPMVDYLLGNCCHVLGHCHPHVTEAVAAQAARSVNVGDHRTELAETLAARILRHAGKDALRFVSSGSEAVHCALRAARAATGRSLVVKFEGHYHGWFAEEIARFVPDLEYAGGLGPGAGGRLVVVPWNDRAAFDAVMAEHGGDVAAVICEPMLCHAGPIPPQEGFLQHLREAATAHGSLLVFDECIVGFRLGLGGGQGHFGVRSDLVTYSKVLSGGLPIGICAGSAEAMAPLADGTAYQAATYDANPLSMAAASAVLDVLEEGSAYERIAAHGSAAQALIAAELADAGVPAVCQGDVSVFQFFLTGEDRVADHAAALGTDTRLYGALVEELLARGINVFKGDLRPNPRASWLSQWFVSAAHGERELDHLAGAYRPALDAALTRVGGGVHV